MDDALALHNLHFGYGRKATVRGVSLRLSPGDCYGFLGHNGAGKTTVMRLALGLLRPTGGTVRIFGHDADLHRRRVHGLVGAVIERPGFHLQATAQQNLFALARLQGITRRLANAEAERVLDAVGLDNARTRRVGAFSMGMRQRLGIAQALLGQPRLLLLDEPTNGLDPEGIAELRRLLLRLTRDEGTAVMLSSHQLAELEGLCNRVGVLREGAMVVEGDLDTLRRRVGIRHVVTGHPLSELAQQLRGFGLTPQQEGDRLFVDLQQRAPEDVARALATSAALTAFAPEQTTLERIYLQAAAAGAAPLVDAAAAIHPDAEEQDEQPVPSPRIGTTQLAPARAFAFEARTLLRQRTTLPLLLAPCVIAAVSVRSYAHRVRESLALVEAGDRFSADAGSGFLAMAQSLQAATPVLALAVLWLASQSVAADLAGDTLRNTLIRSVRRRDVLFAKLAVLISITLLAWCVLVATSALTAAGMVGFGDLEEVTQYGDRDLLAAVDEARPTLLLALVQMMLPLTGMAILGIAASAVAKRPARALAAALALALGPALLHDWLGERAGWLLTSHLPTGVRDDSALGYAAAVARGAADAVWPWAQQAVYVPFAWCLVGGTIAALTMRRLRIA